MSRKNTSKPSTKTPANVAAASLVPATLAKTAELVPAGNPGLATTHVALSKDDVLAIAMDDAARHIKNKLKETASAIEAKAIQAGRHSLAVTRLYNEWVQATFLPQAEKLRDQLLQSGFGPLTARASGTVPSYSDCSELSIAKWEELKTETVVDILVTTDKDKQAKEDTTSVVICRQFTTTLPANIVNEIVAALRLAAEQNALKKVQMDWKRREASLPSLRTQYLAKLARTQLSKTDEGRDMLKELTLGIAADVEELL